MDKPARLSVLVAALAAASIPLSGVAVAAPESGSIIGTAWFDDNGDGVRQLTEPARNGAYLLLIDSGRVVRTDEEGRYRFADVPDGAHRVTDYFKSSEITYTKMSDDSQVDPDTGWASVTVSGGAARADIGYVKAKPDTELSDVDVPLLPVGAEADIAVTFRNAGNSRETLWGNVVLPEGLTPLWTTAPVEWIDGQTVHLSSMYQREVGPDTARVYTIRVRVDAAIDCGELVATAAAPGRDGNRDNNVVKVKITTD